MYLRIGKPTRVVHISSNEAIELIDSFFKAYPAIKNFLDK
jgi:DNA polymerase I-like protein with 3'-5' exonuclease and polymerase domains